eukprot:TRINITY_DN1484_c0_g1_i4.p1 TRINITY_DN1484_c0_g1~~TRINITY_DN1484_c0_g1_i4.p1  ORF type:complete len:339 (-),score=79.25 TRINITY_DN1484_c0_g1_i4:345-1361(-)
MDTQEHHDAAQASEEMLEQELLNQPLETFPVECSEEEHALQSPWSWWFDKKMKAPAGTILSEEDFKANMKKLGTIHSVEQFARYYQNCKKPHELPVDTNLHLMRYNTLPMWECFPLGGCWLIKVNTRGAKMDDDSPGSPNWMWEQLLFSAIGEAFGSPDMIGVSLAVRPKGMVFSVWNLNEHDSQSSRFSIGEKLREIIQLPQYATIEYKYHNMSMRDRSSFRNARPYLIVAAEPQTADQLPPAPATNQTAAPIHTPSVSADVFKPSAWGVTNKGQPEPASDAEPQVSGQEPAPDEASEPTEPTETEAETPQQPDEGDAKEPAKLSFAEMAKRSQQGK